MGIRVNVKRTRRPESWERHFALTRLEQRERAARLVDWIKDAEREARFWFDRRHEFNYERCRRCFLASRRAARHWRSRLADQILSNLQHEGFEF